MGSKINPNKRVVAYVTEAEFKAFKEALKRSGRYHSISEAIRDFIRDFIDSLGVLVKAEDEEVEEK